MDPISHLRNSKDIKSCTQIFFSLKHIYRPTNLKKLVSAVDLDDEYLDDLKKLVNLFGSFLTTQEETVYFIHQSAKDDFTSGEGSRIMPLGQAEENYRIMI